MHSEIAWTCPKDCGVTIRGNDIAMVGAATARHDCGRLEPNEWWHDLKHAGWTGPARAE